MFGSAGGLRSRGRGTSTLGRYSQRYKPRTAERACHVCGVQYGRRWLPDVPEIPPSARDAFTDADRSPAARRAIPAAGRQTVQRYSSLPAHRAYPERATRPTRTVLGVAVTADAADVVPRPLVPAPDRHRGCSTGVMQWLPTLVRTREVVRSPGHTWYAARPDSGSARKGFVILQCGVLRAARRGGTGAGAAPLATGGGRGTTVRKPHPSRRSRGGG